LQRGIFAAAPRSLLFTPFLDVIALAFVPILLCSVFKISFLEKLIIPLDKKNKM